MPGATPPPNKPIVLIVDDTPSNLTLIHGLLKGEYLVKAATGGRNALHIAATVPPPDLILLDVMMPEMAGYEVCARLKADPALADIPVIFLTAMSDVDNEEKGFAVGAVDYITKPVSPPILKARIHTHLALHQAQQRLEEQNLALVTERELVESIIDRMRSSTAFDERNLRYLISPVEHSNGDILLSTFTPDGRHWILAGDFTGHGLPAAVGAPLIAHVFYTCAAQGKTLAAALSEINSVLYRQLPIQIFMAGCLVELNPERTRFKLWNAGMPDCLLMHEGRTLRKMVSRGLPLGVINEYPLDAVEETVEAPRDASLFIFSDGVTEAAAPSGEMFGCDRVESLVADVSAGRMQLEALLPVLNEFHGGDNFDDDITLLEIRI